MNTTTLLMAGLLLVHAAVLTAWALAAMAQVEDDLRAFAGFEEMDFET